MTDLKHRIGIVEDDLDTRQRLARIIDQHEQLEVVGQADSVATAMEMLQAETLDVLLVDIGLPDGSGIDVISASSTQFPDMDIMVVTVFGDSRNVVRAIEAGANGYLLKDGETSCIADAILQLIDGGSPISASIARHILTRFKNTNEQQAPAKETQDNKLQSTVEDSVESLTPREKEVLTLISKGYRYDEIADTLNISYHTVTSHIKQIYRKLAVHSRGEAVFEATRLGLVR